MEWLLPIFIVLLALGLGGGGSSIALTGDPTTYP